MYLAVAIIFASLASLGTCDGGQCTVQDGAVSCGEGFIFPLDVDDKITKLTISSKDLKGITIDDFKKFKELQSIDLSNSGIKTIDEDTFLENTKLQELNLSHNKDLIIPDDSALFVSKSLTKLIMRDVGMTKIPEKIFEEVPNLATLDLADNTITNDIQNALKPTTHLEVLILVKDEKFDSEMICEFSSVSLIKLQFYGDDDQEKFEEHKCVDKPIEKVDPVAEVKENVEDTPKVVDTKATATILDHSEECKMKLQFNEDSNCSQETDGMSCVLTCRDGMEPDTPITNPYICSSKTGLLTPETLPVCAFATIEKSADKVNLTEVTVDTVEKPAATVDLVVQPVGTSDTVENPAVSIDRIEKPAETVDKDIQSIGTIDTIEKPTGSVHAVEKSDVKVNFEEQPRDVVKLFEFPAKDVVDKEAEPKSADIKGKSVDVLVNSSDGQKLGESTSKEENSDYGISSSNIVLGIIVVIMIVGALGMGYKYWKNHHGYHNTGTEDVEEGKELRTISVNNKTIVEQNE